MSDGDLYKIVDSEAAKTVGFYDSHDAAKSALLRMRRDHEALRGTLVLVTMDAKGMPTKFENVPPPRGKGGAVKGGAGKLVRTVGRKLPIRRAVG